MSVRDWLQHRLNEAHIYCRLYWWLPKRWARRIAQAVGRFTKPFIYRGSK